MADQKKKKNKPKKSKRAKNLKSVRSDSSDLDKKEAVPPSDASESKGEEVSAEAPDDKLKELEERYVTRPANVAPPLPQMNPDSIKKSGVQRAYNPTDRNLFPEESVYEMAPFILDEVRLTPIEEPEDDPDKESWGSDDDEELDKDEPEEESKEEEAEPSPAKPMFESEEKFEESQDDWDKAKQSFKGSEGWGEEIYSHEVEDPWSVDHEILKKDEKQESSGDDGEKIANEVNEFDDDYDKEYGLIGEDSIYELEPINLTEFGFGRLTEDEGDSGSSIDSADLNNKPEIKPEEEDREIPEVGPEIVSRHAEQEKIEQEISGNYERFPEFSNFEMEPIRVEEDVLREARNLDLKKQKDIADSISEEPQQVDEEKVERDSESATPYEREVADTLLEGVPIVAPGDSLTGPQEQFLEPGFDPLSGVSEREVEETLLEVEPLEVSKQEKYDAALKARSETVQAEEELVEEPSVEEPAQEQESDEDKRRLIDLAEPDPEVASYVDQIAVQSETAAIAKEIQTQESMLSVGQHRLQEAALRSGLYDLPGQTLEGKYLLRGVIGQGGISMVYKAQDLATGQIVAIKTLKEHEPEVASRFSQEINTLGKLNHQNIVRAIESFTQEGNQTFLVMEHIKGISLQELIKQYGRAEHPEVIASILIQVCDGLTHAHAHRIIHRDLKGGNIVLTNVNEKIVVKILDFGIAKLEDEDVQRVTIEGKAMGSPLYMSPEQCRGQPLTTKSDIYALGIVAYELITGELPIKGRSVVNVMAQHCDPDFRPVPMSNIRPDLPGVHMLDQIIYKALETDVDHRLQRAEQFKSGIKYWIDSVRVRNYSNIIPPEVLFSEEIAMTDQAIEKNMAAETTASPSGKNLRASIAESEKSSLAKSSFPEILGTARGVKFYVFATIVIAVAVILCLYLMKYQGG